MRDTLGVITVIFCVICLTISVCVQVKDKQIHKIVKENNELTDRYIETMEKAKDYIDYLEKNCPHCGMTFINKGKNYEHK